MAKPATKTNPFSDSRVDTAFQNHTDLKEIFSEEFERLESIIADIKNDEENHQSKGAVVTGEPGTGKTHLMMRLAKGRLEHNRLLFIRQPNNLNSVLYHIYSRVLESFMEKVPNSPYSQLEHLLATSFFKIIRDTFIEPDKSAGILDYFRKQTDKDKYLVRILSIDPLNLYRKLGEDGARNKREYWRRIETILDDWWKRNHGDVGYSTSILKGIVKYCSYSDVNKKKLVGKWLSGNELETNELKSIGLKNWSDDDSKEAFSLEAMTVFGKLSIMDEPLIVIFDQLEGLGLEYNVNLLLSFSDAVKELFTYLPNSLIILNLFPDRWESFKEFFDGSFVGRVSQCQIVLNKPSEKQLKRILVAKAQVHGVDIEQLFTAEDLEDILNQDSIREVLNRASHYYRFRIQDIPLPAIRQVKSFEKQVKDQLKSINEQLNVSNFENEVRVALKTIMAEMAILRKLVESAVNLPITAPPATRQPALIMPSVETTPQPVRLLIMDYIEREKVLLEDEYDNKLLVISDSDDVGKLLTITEAFNTLNIETDYLKLGLRKLPKHLLIKTPSQSVVIGFMPGSNVGFSSRIKNFNEFVINNPEEHFSLFRDEREGTITGKVGSEEIDKLNKAANGEFIYMDKENRLTFELIYKMIVDIQNQDFEVDLQPAMKTLDTLMSHYWLIKIFKRTA